MWRRGVIIAFHHLPVLCEEIVAGLQVQAGGIYLDATVGGGGHTLAILQAGAAQIVALDQDRQALAAAQHRVKTWQQGSPPEHPSQLIWIHTNFAQFDPQGSVESQARVPLQFDGILADLGVSSPQLDQPERGFSFHHEGPLDMRMDGTGEMATAADWINHRDERELVQIFSEYGEEHYAKRIARQIVARRPLHTTTQLAELIGQAVPPAARRGRIHPATRVFQALRIAVNQELQVLETLLQRAPNWLKPGGRLAVISFHSLEDRRVKWGFRQDPRWQVITPKPIQAQPEEIARNPRARSAKLRIAARQDPIEAQ